NRLGVTALWIGPLNQGPDSAYVEYSAPHDAYTGYHGYWPISPTVVDPRYGGRDAAEQLVNSAHQHQMKVILDFVANHTHEQHPFYREHPEWYGALQLADGRDNVRLWDERRLDTWFETFLPSFDYLGSDEAIEVMTDNALFWLGSLNLDGFRHDAVKHLPQEFWITLTRKLRAEYPGRHLYQLGESYGSDALIKQYISTTQLDGQFNFNLYFGTRESFALGTGNMADIAVTVEQNLSTYDPLNFMGTLVSSHDQTRFIAFADRAVGFSEDAKDVGWNRPPPAPGRSAHERLRLYYSFILTLPGVPIFYYGDEIGLTGAGDPDNRRPMKWDSWTGLESETFDAISKLLHLRQDHPALAVGDFVRESATEHVLVYRRIGFKEQLLVLLNKGDRQEIVTLPGGDAQWQAIYGKEGSFTAGSEMALEARSGAILLRR
ncbi:MAG: DUF3459 domain-containing protein, partial [Candidatus Marinimicrobia bacterium]|nr:DUF3459 domain-containing protein [Candidatus Neomarinimicrobiota bacterium]